MPTVVLREKTIKNNDADLENYMLELEQEKKEKQSYIPLLFIKRLVSGHGWWICFIVLLFYWYRQN